MIKKEKKGASNIGNALLYSIESITTIIFTVVSISLIARHFGPEVFSRFSVVMSISTIFMVFISLGLDQFIIKEIVRNRFDAEYISSATFGLIAGWLFYVVAMVVYYLIFKDLNRDLFLIVNVVIGTFFLKVIFVKSYLQAINKPKAIALASVVSRLFSIVYLLTGAYFDFSFNVMMMYMPLQALLLTAGMCLNQPEFFKLIRFRYFSLQRLTSMVREATPVFLSTILFFFYTQSDILIMSSLLDASTVGIYSAAIRLIPQAAFIGYILVATFYTEMDKRLLNNKTEFHSYVRSVLSIQFAVGIAMAATVCLGSGLLIHLLYGPRYDQSAKILAISCWAWVFIIPAAIYSRLLIMLGHVRYELIKMLIMTPLVVVLNYLVISRIGMVACAVVFVFSYATVDFFIYFVFRETRYLGVLGLAAIADIFTQPRETFRMSMKLFMARHAA